VIQILPSLLAADFAHLADQIAQVEAGGATMLHLDVMDGHFVPNISFGPPVIQSIRKASRSILDVHLMITAPDHYIAAFADSGADQISVHQEACVHLDRTLAEIKRHKLKAGVVLNPATPIATLDHVLDLADFVLLMSVNPGFGGQKFLPYVLGKARHLDRRRQELGLALPIEIDGGVTLGNAAEIAAAGVDWLVAGSSVFGSEDPASTVRRMQQAAAGARGLAA
jgi:ribulose-phosphate 3-epimerase